MKKTLLLLFVLIILNNVFAQFKQGTLIDDAKYHKRIKNYSKSFELFKEALSKPSNVSDDYYYAVKVALLNKDEDFAFKWLNDYTKIDSYRSIDEIKADSSLFKLHNNQKWEEFLKELTKQNLNKCLELADKYGISTMTMEEITNEVKAVRKNAKNNN